MENNCVGWSIAGQLFVWCSTHQRWNAHGLSGCDKVGDLVFRVAHHPGHSESLRITFKGEAPERVIHAYEKYWKSNDGGAKYPPAAEDLL